MTISDWFLVLGLSALVIVPSLGMSEKHPWLWAIGSYFFAVALGLAITLSLN